MIIYISCRVAPVYQPDGALQMPNIPAGIANRNTTMMLRAIVAGTLPPCARTNGNDHAMGLLARHGNLGRRSVCCCCAEWADLRGDCRRSGYTAENSPSVSPNWQYTPPTRNRPGRTATRGCRSTAPCTRQISAAFFGSSADCKVYARCVERRRAVELFCDGPVRFAPVLAGDWPFVASDDGHPIAFKPTVAASLADSRGRENRAWATIASIS